MDLHLRDRRCLVTGAGIGIGRGIALALAAEGAQLAIHGRSEAPLQALRKQITESGAPEPVVVTGDLTDPDGPRRIAAETASRLGPVEVLVNNAGGTRPLPPGAGQDFWDEAFALNFTAARRLSEAVVPAMREAGWGRIVNISGALAGQTLNAAAPAKAALVSWSKGLAGEVAKFGITVNCVAPGRINSGPNLAALYPTEESRRADTERTIPIGRFGEPEELACLVAFLASPIAGYITGASIPVDGGRIRIDIH